MPEPVVNPTTQTTRSALVGAAFLMATSAIGPGFLTQTAVFTQQLGASFGFAVLASVLADLGAQLTIWRVIAASGLPAPMLANRVRPGLGSVLSALVVIGGLAFNIGNVAGAGLGLEAALGLDVRLGAALSAALALGLFVVKDAGRAMDRFALAMGFLMIGLTVWVAVASSPPVLEAARRTVWPSTVSPLAIVTLVGGTVGGYITFAGAHRLLDAGVHGASAMRDVTRSAATAIGVASLMRVVLFLAALGVVSGGVTLNAANPAAAVFRSVLGDVGERLFGVVMWSAAITSVVGAAYTSVSFLPVARRGDAGTRPWIIGFIVASASVFLLVGRPVAVLVLVGALNALVLPLGLGIALLAARRSDVVGSYVHPRWMTVGGWLVAVAMAGLGLRALIVEVPKLWR
ncbi:MAG: NRAMP family divalent metal transporter [Gemmatimonadaceae bacterium]|nr:NRAMP family divalent metal transporter [Gemmatimonadaceae bacterium]